MGERKTFLDRALGNYKVAELTLQTMSNDDVFRYLCLSFTTNKRTKSVKALGSFTLNKSLL